MSPGAERVQKVLARAGLGSRRELEGWVTSGRIRINGRVARLGDRVDPDKDEVEVDGSPVPLAVATVHYLVNKPAGVVSTAADPHGRPTVLDIVGSPDRLWPVGRLDIDSEGALIVTNDGDLTLRLTHPRYMVPKRYVAEVRGSVAVSTARRLARGIDLEDGPTAPADVRLLERGEGSSLLEVTIREGRNRQVRRMMDAVGHPVHRLVRVAIGPLEVGRLRPGTYRRLGPMEIQRLYAASQLVER